MNSHHEKKGTPVTAGIFALLRGLFRVEGTGARKIRVTVTTTQRLALTAVAAGGFGTLALPVTAQAEETKAPGWEVVEAL
jgi:hypothetical protein